MDNNSTTAQPSVLNGDSWFGYLTLIIAVILFGTNYIPVKRVNTGDGVFFQFVMCSAIFMTGVVIGLIRGFPQIYPEVMIGGFLWATGNLVVVPIVHSIGLGLGLLLWASSTMINGWAGGRFGFFGINAQIPNNIALNYIGVALALISTFLFSFIRPHDKHADSDPEKIPLPRSNSVQPLKPTDQDILPPQRQSQESVESLHMSVAIQPLYRLSPQARRTFGIILAVGTGVLYGYQFTPILYVQEHQDLYPGASQSTLDYIFAFYVGIFTTSTVYFILYCMVLRTRAWISVPLIVPAFVSGTMWAVAEAALLVAIQYLSETISFPIATSIPALISAMLGVLVFREIRGRRNLMVLAVAAVGGVMGAVFTGLSK